MDIPLIAIIGGFLLLSVLEVVLWHKYKAPKYVLYAYTNISTAVLLMVLAVCFYDAVGEFAWIMVLGGVVLLILAVLCIILKRPVFLPSTSQLIMSASEIPFHTVETPIASLQDFQDELGTAMYSGKHVMLLYKEKVTPAFFDLKTGFAGEIAQKLENYRMKAAFVGDFSMIESESFQAFVRESNRGSTLCFVNDEQEAKKRFLNEIS